MSLSPKQSTKYRPSQHISRSSPRNRIGIMHLKIVCYCIYALWTCCLWTPIECYPLMDSMQYVPPPRLSADYGITSSYDMSPILTIIYTFYTILAFVILLMLSGSCSGSVKSPCAHCVNFYHWCLSQCGIFDRGPDLMPVEYLPSRDGGHIVQPVGLIRLADEDIAPENAFEEPVNEEIELALLPKVVKLVKGASCESDSC